LLLQERAKKLRQWPDGRAWAHGAAAVHQQRAERCAAALGPRFEGALASGRLLVTRSKRRQDRKGGSRAFLRIWDADRRLYSVWEHERRVATVRQRCVCGQSGLPLCSCRDHAWQAAELVFALNDWQEEEARFWSKAKGSCCGTMSRCPLAANDSSPLRDVSIAA
jgi:hypothetical protein